MPDQLQLRGGTTTEHATFTGASKEVTIDTTKKTAVVHDASTAGGNPLMREDGANSALINGSVTEPALAFAAGDADNGIYSPGADQVAVTTNGTERVEWGASEVVFNDGGENYDFRVEGDTEANLLFVDASTDRIGVGTASPDRVLEIKNAAPIIRLTDTDNNYSEISANTSILSLRADESNGVADTRIDFRVDASERLRIDSSGRLLVGGTIAPNSETNANLQLVHSAGPQFIFARNDTETTTNEDIGLIRFYNNDDDGNYDECARIAVECESAYTSTSKPTYMRFYTNGGSEAVAERMRIDSSGNVGIGANNPTVLLDLESANPVIRLTDSDATGTPECEVSGAGGDLVLRADRDNEKTSSLIGFEVDGTRRMTIVDSGNVGINSLNPSYKLSVVSSEGEASAQFTDATNSTLRVMHPSAGVGLIAAGSSQHLALGTAFAEDVRIDSSGRLLIGTTANNSESALLQIQGNAGGSTGLGSIALRRGEGPATMSVNDVVGRILFQSSNGQNFGRIELAVDGTSGNGDCPGRLVFLTSADNSASPTERMRISSNSTYYFNTTTANNYGQTNDTLNTGAGTQGNMCFRADNGALVLANNADSTFSSVYINKYSWDSGDDSRFMDFRVNGGSAVGTIQYDGSSGTNYNTSSDYRLKENIVSLTNGIERVKQLTPSRFNFIASPEITKDGFIAHEVAAVVPEAVSGEKDAVFDDGSIKPQGLDASKLVPLLTAALQEAIAKIETLEAKVAALEAN